MVAAEVIAPYVNLITWQVVALLGGAFAIPAFYILVLRTSELDAFGVRLKQREAKAIVEDAEESVEQEIAAGASPEQVLNEAVTDSADNQRDRVQAAMSVWSAVAYIIRDLAVACDAALPNANQTREQIDYLSRETVLTESQAARARELLGMRNRWKANPTRKISEDDFATFRRRSKILGTQLSAILQSRGARPAARPPTGVAPPPITQPEAASPYGPS